MLGAEYVKLGTAFTPAQMVRLPFTRGLLGPAHVTPGGFLNTRADQFVPNSVPSRVTGARARHLAFAMQIDSPYLCLADALENYRDEPGLNFFRKLPTTWDTTRVLSSGLMTHLVQARRKGDSWWIAGMNLQQPKELDLNLDFLSGGNYTLTTYSDTPQSDQQPASLAEQTRVVTRGETIHIRMENTGGFAATLRRVTIPAQPGIISYHWDLHGTIPSDGLSHAGVVPAPHWNNSYPARTSPPTTAGPATSIKDNSGSATPLDIHFSHSAQWQLNPQNTSPTRDLDGSYKFRGHFFGNPEMPWLPSGQPGGGTYIESRMKEFAQLLKHATVNGKIPSGELLPLVYDELRNLASHRMALEAGGATLQPTALVHEAWIRLNTDENQTWVDETHFFRTAATAMRRILVDRAREKSSLKRGQKQRTVSIDDVEVCATDPDDRVLMIDEAMHRFEKEDPDNAEIVNLKFFGGLTNQQIAELRGVTERTIQRQWAYAKSCLYEILRDEHS